MASSRSREALIRQWSLVEQLSRAQRGASIEQMRGHTGASRSTVYRDLGVLCEAGVPIESENINGEARYRLCSKALPPLGPTALQISALRLARRALAGLDGTSAASELDKLLDGYAHASGGRAAISFAKQRALPPDIIKKLDRAIAGQRRVRIRYRSVRASAPEWRTVDPLGLRYVKGHIYFIAYDHKRADYVPFKLDRISTVDVLADKADKHPDFDVHAVLGQSATIWKGEGVEVAVRLSAAVARFAKEYPLVVEQTVEDDGPDGACIVRARVAGVMEAMRWVLSWGKEAEALGPKELREAVEAEVTGAARRYAGRAETARARSGRLARSGIAAEQSRARAMERSDEG
jgi:proteasome accessory factor B